jgi:hypothetical protein
MQELYNYQKDKREEIDPMYLVGGGLALVGLYYLTNYHLQTISNPSEEFEGMKFVGGSNKYGNGIHLAPIVYKSQEGAFRNFEKIINEYDEGIAQNFVDEDLIVSTYNLMGPRGTVGYVDRRDIADEIFKINIATERGYLDPIGSDTVLHVSLHEWIHAQYMNPNQLNFRSLLEIIEGGTLDNGVNTLGEFGLQLVFVENGNEVSSVALLEVGTEYFTSYIKNEMIHQDEFTLDDFMQNSSYFDEVEDFQDLVNDYFNEEVDMEMIAHAFALAMGEDDGVSVFVSNMIDGFELGIIEYEGLEGDADEFSQLLYEFAYENVDLIDY